MAGAIPKGTVNMIVYRKIMDNIERELEQGGGLHFVTSNLDKMYNAFPEGKAPQRLARLRRKVWKEYILDRMDYIDRCLRRGDWHKLDITENAFAYMAGSDKEMLNSFELITQKCKEVGLKIPRGFNKAVDRYKELRKEWEIDNVYSNLYALRGKLYSKTLEKRAAMLFNGHMKYVNSFINEAESNAKRLGIDVKEEAEALREEMFEVMRDYSINGKLNEELFND